jgi:anion-transporting  ArsA/GET3 family ATPase
LQEQSPRDENQRSAGFILDRYLDNLTSYAETVCDTYSDRSDGLRPISRAGSSGEDGSINEIESTLRAISSTPRELDSNSHDERKEREAALARVKAFEPRVEAARDEVEEKEARLVAQRAVIEASKAHERELQRQLQALAKPRVKATRVDMKMQEARLVAQRAVIEASKVRERRLQRELQALDEPRVRATRDEMKMQEARLVA